MAKTAGYRWLCVFVVLTLLLGLAPRLAPVVQAAPVTRAAPAEPDLPALPQTTAVDPLARMQALLGMDPQTRAIDSLLGDLAGASPPADGRAGPYGPLSPALESPGAAPPALPKPPRPEVPLPVASTLTAFDAGALSLAQRAGDDGAEAPPPAAAGEQATGNEQPAASAPQRFGQSTSQAHPSEVVAMVAASPVPAGPAADPAPEKHQAYLPLVSRNYAAGAITSQGGTYVSPDGVVTLDFPRGAVDEPVTIDYRPAAPAQRAGQSQPLMPGAFRIEARTAGGQAVSLSRPVAVRIAYPAATHGPDPLLRWWDEARLRWVSVGSYSPAMSPQAADGQAVLAASVTSLGTFALSDDDDEDPDEGEDGLLITRVCWEPELDLEYTIFDIELYTTTQEADPWAMMWVFWEKEGEEGEYEVDFYDWEARDFTHEPLVTVTLETVGPYTVGQVFSYTVFADDVISDTWRYDFHEGAFQVGTMGCVDGGSGCEPIPPVIEYVDIWQSGTGFSVVTVRATDNAGEPTVELFFNGQTVAMTPLGNGLFVAQVDYYPFGNNTYQVMATDGCGNRAIFPTDGAITVPASWSGTFGDSLFTLDNCPPGFIGCESDPVNTVSGNFVYQTTDLTVAGVGDTDLVIERTYNSMAAVTGSGRIVRYEETGGVVTSSTVSGTLSPFGNAWSFPYDVSLYVVANGLMSGVQVRYADGRTVNYQSNGDGTFAPLSPYDHDVLVLEGDEYVLRHKRTLEVERFDLQGRLVAKEDRNGNRIRLTYDGTLPVSIENDSGRALALTYDGEGHIVQINAPEGKEIRYEYSDGNLVARIDTRGNRTEYRYDENNQLVEIITPNGYPALRLAYDEDWRVVQQIEGAARQRTFAYDDEALVTTLTDAYGHQTLHTYDEEGRLVALTDALGYSESYGYDEDNNRIYLEDKGGREWHYTFDERGNKLTEEGPLGWHRAWEYNDLDLITLRQDAEGRVTRFEYDSQGNLVRIVNALGASSETTYDGPGLPTQVFDFNGNETVNTYDPVTGDLIETRNGAGDRVSYAYDALGRMRTMTDGRGSVHAYTYDGNDNLMAEDGPLGYHLGYQYDANDNLTREIDPNGGETDYFYDESENLVRVENPLSFATGYAYDDMNNLVGMEDPEGRVWTYAYDARYQRVAEHGPEDTHTFFAYDSTGNRIEEARCNSPLSGSDCPVKQITRYQYDDLDRVVHKIENYKPGEPPTADTNVTTQYAYDLVGNLLTLTDANGNPTTYEYDSLDRLVREEDAEGQVTHTGYDGMANVTEVVNPRGYRTEYTYDAANRLETTTDALGNTWIYTYDGNSNLVDTTDPLGVVTHLEYDELDRLRSQTLNYLSGEPATTDRNVTTQFAYDLAGNLRFVTDPRGTYQTEHRYDAAQRRILTLDAEGGETTYGYDGVNNLARVVDANGHETAYAYNGLDRQVRVTNAEMHSVTFGYDRLGNLLALTDARGNPTTFAYDGMNRPVLRVDALLGERQYEYDAMGNLLREIDANGHANNTYTYDRAYRRLSSTDAERYATTYSYDENGNNITVTDGNGHPTHHVYDELDRLASTTNAEGETTGTAYDPLGNQTRLIEADGTVTLYAYDPLSRLAGVIQNWRPGEAETADTNVDTHYGYDEAGNLLSILDAEEHATHFGYDGLNRLMQEVDALGNTWTYTYDGVGNRLSRLDANGALTTYETYPDDQLKLVSYADGTSVGYGYDANNNRTSMVDGLGQTTWAYDALNRVTEVVDAFGRGLQFGYDGVGKRVTMTYADGNVVGYEYYDNDWLETMVDPEGNVTAYQRDGVGNVTFIDNPNSTVTEIGYDRANRVLWLINRQTVGGEETNSAFAYTYNEVGHVTEVASTYGWRNPPLVTESFFYDGLHRLGGMEDSDGTVIAYSYDRVGNRLIWETNDDLTTDTPLDGFAASYDYNGANQLLTATIDSETPNGDLTVAYGYDANGNRTGKLVSGRNGPEYGTDYGYDPENRLVVAQDYQLVDHVNRVDRAITALAYDGEGRRLVKTYDPKDEEEEEEEGPKRVEYLFDGLDPVAEYELLSGQRANYYRGAMGRITTWHHFPAGSPGQMFWYHYNFKGDVVGLTKQGGQSTHNYRYDPYGGVVPALGNFTDPHNHYTLTGKEWDEKTELVYFGARHYDPGAGVWMTQDTYRGTLSDPVSKHRYLYVAANPASMIDAYGYSASSIPKPAPAPTPTPVGSPLWSGYYPAYGLCTDPSQNAGRAWILEKAQYFALAETFLNKPWATKLATNLFGRYIPRVTYWLNAPGSPLEYRLADISKAASYSKASRQVATASKFLAIAGYVLDFATIPLRYADYKEAEEIYQATEAAYGKDDFSTMSAKWESDFKKTSVWPVLGEGFAVVKAFFKPKPVGGDITCGNYAQSWPEGSESYEYWRNQCQGQ